jgi:hypothetical protein
MLGFLRRNFLSIDPRTLGLLRIGIACLLLLDLAKRLPVLRLFYTNASLIPNHRVLWRPPREYMFSYLLALSSVREVQVGFALIALVYLCLLVGFRTKLMQVLSWLSLISLQTRADILSSGADFVFGELLLWSAFLPLGRRFSIDAWLRGSDERDTEPVVSLAVLALIMQLVVIYFFNTVHKNGVTWRDGSAVYWLVHQERIVTLLGYWAREALPLWVFQGLTYLTLVIEGALPLLILSPWGRPFTRRLALLSIIGLHTGMALMSNLGVFSPTMIVFGLCLVEPRDWELWEARGRRFNVPLAGWIERLGLSARPAQLQPTAALAHLRRVRFWAGQLLVLMLMFVATSQLLVENPAIPRWLQHQQPRSVRAAVGYLRLNQGWSMFAPDAPREDMWIVVDAVTSDGRHVDPWNEVASRVADPSLRSIPPRLAQAAAYCDYTSRIPDDDILHEPFRDWILDYHRRTRRPEDQIVKFRAYAIEQHSPAPGQSEPHDVRSRVFLSK